jgi:hypothetical protein
MAVSDDDSPRDHSTDSGVSNILRVNWGDHHGVYDDTAHDTVAPHRRAALDSCKFGKVNIDFMKEGKDLFSLNEFW